MRDAPLFWSPASGPEDLARIEAVPLADRGLPATSRDVLLRAAERWPDRPAVSVLPDAERWESPVTRTFAQLADDVARAAGALSALGVAPGQAVSVLSVNCDELLTTLLAAEAVGVYAPVNPGLAAEHAVHLVRRAGARVLVAAGPELDPAAWALAREVAATVGLPALVALRPTGADGEPPALAPLEGVRVAYLRDLVDRIPGGTPLPGPPPGADDAASYLHTGGTTGTPKLAVRTHANQVTNAWAVACNDALDPDDTVLAALPLFHTNAIVVTVLAPLLRGQHVLWAGPLGYRDLPLYGCFWRLVERYRIAAMSAVPTVYQVLTQVPVDADVGSLKVPVVGAAPLPTAVREAWAAHTGVELCDGYGLTEATCASSRSWPGAPRPGTVGQRVPYQDVAAVAIDERTGERTVLPPGEAGALVVRGPHVFAGYLREDGTLDRSAVRDGWLDTGDLGAVDADGFVRLVGRAKDLIIRGGHNIDPQGIEDALLEHPAVTMAAAVGRPDPHAGEVPVAFVTVAPGSDVTAEALHAWAQEHAPERAAAPRTVDVVAEIPLTLVGKPYKPELRRRAAEAAARDALDGTAAADGVRAVLVDGAVEIEVASSADDDAVRAALGAFGWTWRWAR
ncbi:acyl-CoA synthetase [Patulibacter sp. SYSU D01012]|uniref:acyl-CoA synthetase n=1 Tax=Patulibacter sp. SYSU D01012 TaxID=2817381 RepID=UPI001B3088C6|nr:acyl-CoA synthetase [Patulibacter sp. SYSU D01012]